MDLVNNQNVGNSKKKMLNPPMSRSNFVFGKNIVRKLEDSGGGKFKMETS